MTTRTLEVTRHYNNQPSVTYRVVDVANRVNSFMAYVESADEVAGHQAAGWSLDVAE